jgi:hypothetical protein
MTAICTPANTQGREFHVKQVYKAITVTRKLKCATQFDSCEIRIRIQPIQPQFNHIMDEECETEASEISIKCPTINLTLRPVSKCSLGKYAHWLQSGNQVQLLVSLGKCKPKTTHRIASLSAGLSESFIRLLNERSQHSLHLSFGSVFDRITWDHDENQRFDKQ